MMKGTMPDNHRECELEGKAFIGIDAGAETLKLVEVVRSEGLWRINRREIKDHGKKPGSVLLDSLSRIHWQSVAGAAVTGLFSPQIRLRGIPTKQAQLQGCRFFFGSSPVTVINIGSHGFSVLEIRENGIAVFRENNRCSQGTGNFLSQLVERFSLTVQDAAALCTDIQDPAPLSGRCPVILKTDMTHLANKGEDRARILAGLFDAVCENVLTLVRPGDCPKQVLLTGGLSRSPRVRRVLSEALVRQGMEIITLSEEDSLCIDALGCSLIAAENPAAPPSLESLLSTARELKLEKLPSLADSLCKVHSMPAQPWAVVNGKPRSLVLGFDIGSTGSKAVALDLTTKEIVWDAYRQTLGDPIGAAQDLLQRFGASPASKYPVLAFGATGSGREIVGSLLTACYGRNAVFVVNELVAHATGALHFDARVDTIFEIGGQDAKYIRIAEGRIVDCAMNEACSAGTGSFIEEQGRKFSDVQSIRQLGQIALEAPSGVSLGQHCSVFMSEVIDEAVAAGVEQPAIISGLYDSIVKNYLNRVKGNRSIGKLIFCQGMPFSSKALAAAVARQTEVEVVVPPNPGNVGALGIALLASRELDAHLLLPLDLAQFLDAQVDRKDTFICSSVRGCGGAGNHCRIDRLNTRIRGRKQSFTWGGGCSLHDKGTRKKKLPDLAPDPFRERDEALQKMMTPFAMRGHKPRIALSDEFMLKGLLPFFAGFFYQSGFDVEIVSNGGNDTLKRGIQMAQTAFCAPMQLFHGLAGRMLQTNADWIFVPMLLSLPRSNKQRCSVVCPIVQSVPDLIRRMMVPARSGIADAQRPRLLDSRIDFGEGGLHSKQFRESCRTLAQELGLRNGQWRDAVGAGIEAQEAFDRTCKQIGHKTLNFCRSNGVMPVVVLGRNYTVYNTVLNSNVPAILREQGVIGIPIDCLPMAQDSPMFSDMYWGYGQDILRAAHQVRRTKGMYAIYCSNYSCGPDSFNLHFAAYAMEGKPFAVIETDGHSGDAGTKTRIEAFLHCAEEDSRVEQKAAVLNHLGSIQFSAPHPDRFIPRPGLDEKMLLPYIGPASEVGAAVFRGLGLNMEALPAPTAQTLRIGRKFTSGKECLPMPLTLGSLIQRLESAKDGERFVYLMSSTDGPCRFGVYNLLNNVVLERLGWRERVCIWSPKDTGYFDDMPKGTEILVFAGVVASDLLLQAKLDTRPTENIPGAAELRYAYWKRKLADHMESVARGKISLGSVLGQVFSGGLFGLRKLLERAGADFASLRKPREMPTVKLAGEIYVRAVEFSNDCLIEKLEARGLRVQLANIAEWMNYCSYIRKQTPGRNHLSDRFSSYVQHRIESSAFSAIAGHFGWAAPPDTETVLTTAQPYVNRALQGEAILTVGAALHEWRQKQIDGVVNVGPLECMPTKIAEAQFHHIAEQDGLISLTLAFNGEPINSSTLDNFAYEVHNRFQTRMSHAC
jgi:predicted CoA-substrate-specific enzyme activase